MKRNVFLAMVLADVMSIKEKATSEEKEKLNYGGFNPTGKNQCLLGQMTGSSESERASELVSRSLYGDGKIFGELCKENVDVQHGLGFFGESPKYTDLVLPMFTTENVDDNPMSAVEWFLLFDKTNVKEMISFIKGETDSFEPSMIQIADEVTV